MTTNLQLRPVRKLKQLQETDGPISPLLHTGKLISCTVEWRLSRETPQDSSHDAGI